MIRRVVIEILSIFKKTTHNRSDHVPLRGSMSGYRPEAIANYFLDLASKEGEKIDPLKIQKLVYFAHGWNLAIYDKPLISEPVEAWRFGPVISDLYQAFKHYGNEPITAKAEKYDFTRAPYRRFAPEIPETDMATRMLVKKVWDAHKVYTGIQLSNVTHQPGTPWANTWGKKNTSYIPDEEIKAYFKGLQRS